MHSFVRLRSNVFLQVPQHVPTPQAINLVVELQVALHFLQLEIQAERLNLQLEIRAVHLKLQLLLQLKPRLPKPLLLLQ
jgi:hypothetical protein